MDASYDLPGGQARPDDLADEYDAALAELLAFAERPPSRLSRLQTGLLRMFEAYQAELARHPLENWCYPH